MRKTMKKKPCYCKEMCQDFSTMYQISFTCPKHGAVSFTKQYTQYNPYSVYTNVPGITYTSIDGTTSSSGESKQ